MDAPVVPMTFAQTEPKSRKSTLPFGVACAFKTTEMPEDAMYNAPKSEMNCTYSTRVSTTCTWFCSTKA